jgi:hypothetical protein
LQDANGDPIDLGAMPRPHRRRREKKLMTMEEVNERFPLMKYKTWRLTREQEGLPAAGGISTPPSRAASIKESGTAGAAGDSRDSTDSPRPSTALSQAQKDHAEAVEKAVKDETERKSESKEADEPKEPKKSEEKPGANDQDASHNHLPDLTKAETSASSAAPHQSNEPRTSPPADGHDRTDPPHSPTTDEDDDDDPIAGAAPPELLSSPGDTCAICLDTIEDDDDVRGLTCGHAFHSSCVDPWLTSRRACCPLCKADYYIPKPRPEGEENAERSRGGILPAVQPSWMTYRAAGMPLRPRMVLMVGSRNGADQSATHYEYRRAQRAPTNMASRRSGEAQSSADGRQQEQQPRNWRSALPNVSMPRMPNVALSNPFRRGQAQGSDNAQSSSNPTPGQLEAGTRS